MGRAEASVAELVGMIERGELRLPEDEADSTDDELQQRFNRMTFVVATRKLEQLPQWVKVSEDTPEESLHDEPVPSRIDQEIGPWRREPNRDDLAPVDDSRPTQVHRTRGAPTSGAKGESTIERGPGDERIRRRRGELPGAGSEDTKAGS